MSNRQCKGRFSIYIVSSKFNILQACSSSLFRFEKSVGLCEKMVAFIFDECEPQEFPESFKVVISFL